MSMKDLVQICHDIDEARAHLHAQAWAIVEVHWDKIKDILSKEVRDNYQRLSLAKQAAERDLDECLSVEAEAASFREESNAN